MKVRSEVSFDSDVSHIYASRCFRRNGMVELAITLESGERVTVVASFEQMKRGIEQMKNAMIEIGKDQRKAMDKVLAELGVVEQPQPTNSEDL